MASFQPFEPALGKTVLVVPSSTAQNVQFTGGTGWNSVLVSYASNATTPVVYLRISLESSVNIVSNISNADLPLLPNSTTAVTTVRLFAASAGANGVMNIAVYCTVAPSVGTSLYLTPGQGGDV